MKRTLNSLFRFMSALNCVVFSVCAITFELEGDFNEHNFMSMVKIGLITQVTYIAYKLTLPTPQIPNPLCDKEE